MSQLWAYLLGFGITALYWPGIAGAATTPRWALLAVALPVLLILKPRNEYKITIGHVFGFLFLAWSAVSILWTSIQLDGIGEWIKLLILALAFVLGSRMESAASSLKGLALGLLPSSFILLIEPWYPDLVLHTTTHAGLFINSGSLGEIAALVLIGLVYESSQNNGSKATPIHDYMFRKCLHGVVRCRLSILALALLPCVILPQSRGSWLALIAASIVYIWTKSKIGAVALIALAAILFTYSLHIGFHVSSVIQRMGLYADAISGMTWLGHGLGSLWTDYAPLSNTLDIFKERPEHLHNDWLEIVFEGGFPAAIISCGIAYCIWSGRNSLPGIILFGFAAEALVGFPLHVPATAFVAALCLGHLARRRDSLCDVQHDGGVHVQLGNDRPEGRGGKRHKPKKERGLVPA